MENHQMLETCRENNLCKFADRIKIFNEKEIRFKNDKYEGRLLRLKEERVTLREHYNSKIIEQDVEDLLSLEDSEEIIKILVGDLSSDNLKMIRRIYKIKYDIKF